MKFETSDNVNYVYMTSLLFDVIGRLYCKDQENSKSFLSPTNSSSISCIKDKSIASSVNVTRLLLLFENLRLALAKKRCECECKNDYFFNLMCFFHQLRHMATFSKCLFSNLIKFTFGRRQQLKNTNVDITSE